MKLIYKILIGIGVIIAIILTIRLANTDENIEVVQTVENKLISGVRGKYPFCKINAPVLMQKNDGNNFDGLGDFEFYSFKGNLEDTIVNLSFYYYLEDSLFRIDKYSKIYQDDSFYYHLLMGVDTLFFYKENKNISEDKVFFVGEYNYRFMNHLFTPDEMDYYMKHKDSLGKVSGNNLPQLPSL